MELDRLHARISTFLTKELSSDWTLLKDASKCCITIVKTSYYLQSSSSTTSNFNALTREWSVVKLEPNYGLQDRTVTVDTHGDNIGVFNDDDIGAFNDGDGDDASHLETDKVVKDAFRRGGEENERVPRVVLDSVEENGIDDDFEDDCERDDENFFVDDASSDEDFQPKKRKKTLSATKVEKRRVSLVSIAQESKRRGSKAPTATEQKPRRTVQTTKEQKPRRTVLTTTKEQKPKRTIPMTKDSELLKHEEKPKLEKEEKEEAEEEEKKEPGRSVGGRRKSSTTTTTKYVYPSRFYKRVSGTNTYVCKHPKCGKVFNSAGGCYTHFLRVHKNLPKVKDKRCEICSEAFSSRSRLSWHKDVWHPESIPSDSQFICDVCGKILSSHSTLKAHRRILHDTKKINYFKFCRICHVYIDKVDLKAAAVTSVGAAVATGDENNDDVVTKIGNNDKSSFKASLLNHFVLNHPDELFVCPHEACDEKFVKKSQMNRHVTVVHDRLVNVFPCPHCAKTLATSKKLSFHIDAAHPENVGDMNFVCHWSGCFKAFSSDENLKVHADGHMRRERGKVNGHVPRKQCKICGKAVAPTYLSLHVRNAHGPKPEPSHCGECDAVCVSARALKNHIKKFHSGVIFTCDACSKTFNYKGGLESHIERVHEKKRHKCTECDKVYGGRKEMLVHYRAVHKGIRFPCRMCHREFLRGPDRNRHERSFHNLAKWNEENDA